MQSGFLLHELRLSVRFVHGYRYLDRAGMAMIRLEDVLEQEWMPAEISPKSGNMRNDLLGMLLMFNTEGLNVIQSGVISPPHFLDQAAKIVDILASVFEVDTLLSPGVGIEYQKGYELNQEQDAERALRELGLVTVSETVTALLGSTPQALNYAIVNQVSDRWHDVEAEHTRRLGVRVIRQARQESTDDRLLSRAKLLPSKQRDALLAIGAIKKLMPVLSPMALHVEFENRLEGEVMRADFPHSDFITESLAWAEQAIVAIARKLTKR